MKRIVLASLVLAFSQMQAQEVEWSAPVSGKPTSIFFHDFTQTPIVETAKTWYGVNSDNHNVAWSVNKSTKNEAMKKVSKVNALTGGESKRCCRRIGSD